jgi:hypothetical protein
VPVEAAGLGGQVGLEVGAGVDHPVEDDRPHPVGKLVGVERAQCGPVAEAVEAHALVAQRSADGLHVLDGVVGGDVGQPVACGALAVLGDLRRSVDEFVGLLGVIRGGVERPKVVDRCVAVDRLAAVGATRVPADDVEMVP